MKSVHCPALGKAGMITGLGLLVLLGGGDPARATSARDERREELGRSYRAGAPMLAVVALRDQRITIYDAGGKMLQAPVSTGATGYETPAGIYSVVQKKAEHHSNLYEDGHMPFMQRITWTGIALHAGALPGHPASHGCVRMPHAFAERLFDLTEIGLRVIIVPSDIAPADIDHPNLFKPNVVTSELEAVAGLSGRSTVSDRVSPRGQRVASVPSRSPPSFGSPEHLEILKSIATKRSAEADLAAKRAKDARLAATRKAADAAAAAKALRVAEANHAKAEATLKSAESTIDPAAAPEAAKRREATREKAAIKLAETHKQLETARARVQASAEAATRAEEEAKAVEAARESAADAAAEAARKTSPASVFISRKMQRLYIRQAHQPVFEAPVTIENPEAPLGTYVFTAVNHANDRMRWNVVSMYAANAAAEPAAQGQRRRSGARDSESAPADVAGAKAALDRISISPEAMEHISQAVLPGSSLIISDEGASIETGKDTDFVVIMSGEPQGGIKARRREQPVRYRDSDFFGRSPFGRGGGFPFFW